jgi:hypothetical protein
MIILDHESADSVKQLVFDIVDRGIVDMENPYFKEYLRNNPLMDVSSVRITAYSTTFVIEILRSLCDYYSYQLKLHGQC